MNLTIKNIIAGEDIYSELSQIRIFNLHKDKISELLQELKKEDIEKMRCVELDYITKFLLHVPSDELVSYLLFLLDRPNETTENVKIFLRQFKEVLMETKQTIKNQYMNNFTNKQKTLNTNVNLTQEPFGEKELQIPPKKVPEKEKVYICIVNECYKVGTLEKIEDWLDDEGYDNEDDDIALFELKSEKELQCSFYKKTTIVLN